MCIRDSSYSDALGEAQQLGYAEADPALDVNGWDAAHKAIILASLSYGRWVPCEKIHVEGIESVRTEDITFAAKLGYAIKLLGVIQLHDESGSIEVRVQPSLIPANHILASVKGVYNAIMVRGDIVTAEDSLRQCDQRVHLHIREILIAVVVAVIDQFDANGMGIEVRHAFPLRNTRMPCTAVFLNILCRAAIDVDHIMRADAPA